ncbi:MULTISPECIES: hypothetical protein [unclassified Schaalia]|uniref:hypothetical protein n=1 Tax=unclassified Schaalia TaxID=2691889 RepID=UPI001E55B2B5|nr:MULTISPECIES: hypothetical protein [unclassified Schaalia]MCD4549650.1 hypothetical protein [Schaalia sp. lx-260]MCD4556713.1 hypothetical protein [Schaalia sp. lx-100]
MTSHDGNFLSDDHRKITATLLPVIAKVSRVLWLCAVCVICTEVMAAFLGKVHWSSLVLSLGATFFLVGIQVFTLRFIARDPQRIVLGIGAGYILKITVLLTCVLCGRALDLHTFFIGLSIIVTVIIVMVAEFFVFISLNKSAAGN